MHRTPYMIALCLLAAATCCLSESRLDRWMVIGPGGGGTMIGPAISPHDPKTVVEHCDMTGAYITRDGGESWRMFNLRTGVDVIAFDPRRSNVVFAGNAALWRSEDSGKSWRAAFPDPSLNTKWHASGDHADSSLTTDDPNYPSGSTITAIAVDPQGEGAVYVAFSGPNSRVMRCKSDGTGCSAIRDLTIGRVLLVAPHNGEILAAGENGICRGVHCAPGPGGKVISVSAGYEAGGLVLYLTTGQGLFISTDSGSTWKPLDTGFQPRRFGAIACSERNPGTAYVGFSGLAMGQGPANLFNGIAKTVDRGRTWRIVHRESTKPSSNLEGSWVEKRAEEGGQSIWFDTPYSLGVAPTNADICYATDLFRTYRTVDGGQTWRQGNSKQDGAGGWTTRGLDVTTAYGVHFDPFNPRGLYISYTDIGLFRSEDGGATWTGSTSGIPDKWRNTTYWIEPDPAVRGRMWGAFSGTHDLPRGKMWRHRDPWTFQGGVAISTDGGRSWQPSNSGMAETAVTHVLLDPSSPVQARVLYACAFGRGVYKSVDGGKSWTLKNSGIDGRQPFAWRMARAKDGRLYLTVARRSENGQFGDENDGAIYVSRDNAETWVRLPLPPGVNGPNSLVPDPRNPNRVYLAAWGVKGTPDDHGGGAFVSEDGGRSWKPMFTGVQHVYDITVDPDDPRNLYLCGFEGSAWRSTDRGANWTRLGGYNFKWGHRVVLDPRDKEKIFITTFGGSVWHGPSAGDPAAAGDIVGGKEQ